MFIFLLQLREARDGRWGVLLFLAVFDFIVWGLWVAKTLLSRRYRPWLEPFDTTASVIVPVVDEPVELFRDVLQRITAQHPYEVIVVINGARNKPLEAECMVANVTWVWTPIPGKRNAIKIGTELARGEVVVLVDSDTIWTESTLPELLKPFTDPRIGGVTTKQRILRARNWQGDEERAGRWMGRVRQRGRLGVARFIRRWADWMENSRARYSLPAQSVLGQVGCLPGRTIAFRRHIVERAMDDFMTKRFLGVFLEVSDDRTLTNLCLKQGYRTAYQATSLVYTDAPTKIRKLSKQQLRWARGSQYNTLRMLPWMAVHAPLLALFFVADLILPFLLFGTVFAWGWHSHTHTGVNFMAPILQEYPGPSGWVLVVFFVITGATLSMWLRQHRHLVDEPADYLRMPAFVLFSSFYLMPIRLFGFFRMAHAASWGTRANGYDGDAHRHWNLYALTPYLLGGLLIGLEIASVILFS